MLKSWIGVNEYDEIHTAKKIRTCLATLGRHHRYSSFNIDLCRNESENNRLTTRFQPYRQPKPRDSTERVGRPILEYNHSRHSEQLYRHSLYGGILPERSKRTSYQGGRRQSD